MIYLNDKMARFKNNITYIKLNVLHIKDNKNKKE